MLKIKIPVADWSQYDMLPVGIIVIRRDYSVLFWNDCIAEWSGISAREMTGTNLLQRFPNLTRNVTRGRIDLVFDGGPAAVFSPQFHPHIIPAIHPNGGQRFLSTTVVPHLAGGDLNAMIVIEDVTDLYLQTREYRNLKNIAEKELRERKRAEDALRESESYLNSILHGSPVLQFVLDKNHRIVSWNRALEQYSGVKEADVLGTRDQWKAFYDTKRPVLADFMIDGAFEKLTEFYPGKFSKSPFVDGAFEITDFYPKMGIRGVWLHFTAVPIRDSKGIIIGAIETLEDITERKRAEEALQESEVKFREIFNSANDAIHLHEIDGQGLPGKFIDLNEVACRMVRYSREELLEMSPLDLTTDYHSRPLEQIGKEIKTKGSSIFETEHRRKDGVIVPVEVSVHVVVIEGRRMVLSIIPDLTERKKAEAAFRRLSEDHKAIIGHAPAMIFYKDTKNNFIRVNPAGARAFGMPIDKIEGNSCYDLFPDFAEKYYQDDLEVIQSGKPKLGIIEPMTTTSGEHLWVQTDKIPLKDAQGTVTGILLFVVDITERKQLEDALRMVNKKLNLLSGITRHDISNQLMALNAFIALSEDAVDNPAELKEFFAKEIKITETLAEQISFTKDYEDIGVKSPAWQNVSAVIRSTGSTLPIGNIRFDIGCPGLEVFADPLLEKVFYNLIENSLHYGGEKMTTIRVTAGEQGADLRIVLEDDGNGISTDDKKQLFAKGFGKHTGLGLFLSREILSITGIAIIETGEPGKGARFEITVPKGMWRFADNQ